MFRGAVLGQKQQMRREEEEEEVDGRLLGPIQRYDRLNRVLGLLQQVREGEGQGVELRDLRQHIKSALDEAVRLRADTESLEHTAKVGGGHYLEFHPLRYRFISGKACSENSSC